MNNGWMKTRIYLRFMRCSFNNVSSLFTFLDSNSYKSVREQSLFRKRTSEGVGGIAEFITVFVLLARRIEILFDFDAVENLF